MGSVTKADIDRLVDGTTVAREFVDTVARCADSTALRWMQLDGTLGSVSFAEFGDRAARGIPLQGGHDLPGVGAITGVG